METNTNTANIPQYFQILHLLTFICMTHLVLIYTYQKYGRGKKKEQILTYRYTPLYNNTYSNFLLTL